MSQAKVIVVGNEKGGAGKSTIAIHVATALLHGGAKVATLDLDVRQQLQRFVAQEAQLRQSLQQRMGEATRLRFEQGSVTWKKVKDAQVLDGERLAQDHPHLVERYRKPKAGGRRFAVQVRESGMAGADQVDEPAPAS